MIDFSDVKDARRALHLFLEISKVPRGSGNSKTIADFLINFARRNGLEYIRDPYDNVIIKKSASEGYSTHPTVILQSHTDIVLDKTAECKKDLTKEGLDVYRDGDFLRARGTTLGADDGIGVAITLAILENKSLKHPPIEALFTSDEETGLIGAGMLDATQLSGRMLINLDSDDEDVFTVGCAGGVRIEARLTENRRAAEGECYRLAISGLLGGHSGTDINLGRANAIKLLAEILTLAKGVRLVKLSGGSKDNAIAREAEALFFAEDISALSEKADKIKKDYFSADGGITVVLEGSECEDEAFDTDVSSKIIGALCAVPFGVIKVRDKIHDFVESSVNHGIVRTDSTGFEIHFSVRADKEAEKERLCKKIGNELAKRGIAFSFRDAYPGWEYRESSPLRDTMVRLYEERYGIKPRISVIHAGLECGILVSKSAGLDCVSVGPDNYDYHTTNEHLSIPSCDRFYGFLTEVLKNI